MNEAVRCAAVCNSEVSRITLLIQVSLHRITNNQEFLILNLAFGEMFLLSSLLSVLIKKDCGTPQPFKQCLKLEIGTDQ